MNFYINGSSVSEESAKMRYLTHCAMDTIMDPYEARGYWDRAMEGDEEAWSMVEYVCNGELEINL